MRTVKHITKAQIFRVEVTAPFTESVKAEENRWAVIEMAAVRPPGVSPPLW